MSVIPDATLTVRDGALGIAPIGLNGIAAKVGQASAGTTNTVVAAGNAQTLKDTFGSGPLVEAAAHVLSLAGGPVACVRAPSSTAGAAGSVTPTKTGTATLAISGSAYDAYDLQVVIVQGGATLVAGTATFKYSLDGGRTWSAELAVPTGGVYLIPNTNLTLTWTYSSGTAFAAADQWVATVTGPASTLTELMLGVDALLASGLRIFNVHVMGVPADVTAAAALFAALESKLQTAASSQYQYLYGTMDMPNDTDANIKTAFASTVGTRTEAPVGFENLTSAITGAAPKRPISWSSTSRAASVPPKEDLGRVKSGSLKGVQAISRDEFATQGMDSQGFTTVRTIVGKTGYFLTTGRLRTQVGSDFSLIQYRRVMDIASAAVRAAQLEYLNDDVRVNKTTGLILEQDAKSIESFIEAQLRLAVTQPGYASDCSVQVDRTVNILSTQRLSVKYRVIPLGYAKYIDGEIGFFNPALQAV
jgi:hypothetical protein